MEDKQIYHERQRLQFCLLHALNNLFQGRDSFTRADLDAIADKLVLDDPNRDRWTPLSLVFKPHRNSLTGNYDANVLIAALEVKRKKIVWHDHRRGAASIDLNNGSLIGIMLNLCITKFHGLWKGRHWATIRSIDGRWYNLDSDLREPKSFKDEKELIGFLDNIIAHNGEIFLIFNE